MLPAGLRTTEKTSDPVSLELQLLPFRPLPEVCLTAVTTVPSGAPASAMTAAAVLVESTDAKQTTV
jgi:hypothetical protein